MHVWVLYIQISGAIKKLFNSCFNASGEKRLLTLSFKINVFFYGMEVQCLKREWGEVMWSTTNLSTSLFRTDARV